MSKQSEETVLEMDEILERILYFSLEEAKQKKMELKYFTPFVVRVDAQNMYVNEFSGDDKEQIRTCARKSIEQAEDSTTHYAYCYDGFLDADPKEGVSQESTDCIIVECASQDMEEAFAIILPYSETGDVLDFEENPAFVGNTETFFLSE